MCPDHGLMSSSDSSSQWPKVSILALRSGVWWFKSPEVLPSFFQGFALCSNLEQSSGLAISEHQVESWYMLMKGKSSENLRFDKFRDVPAWDRTHDRNHNSCCILGSIIRSVRQWTIAVTSICLLVRLSLDEVQIHSTEFQFQEFKIWLIIQVSKIGKKSLLRISSPATFGTTVSQIIRISASPFFAQFSKWITKP